MLIPIALEINITMIPSEVRFIRSEKIVVEGVAEKLEGNLMPSTTNAFMKEIPLSQVEIIAAKGLVKSHNGNPSIPIEQIGKNFIKSTTDKEGKFRFLLTPGVYTFFILKDNNAYLNKFDGKGFFKKTIVEKDIYNLVLKFDRNAYY